MTARLPLPLRTRVRLYVTGWIDACGSLLTARGHHRVAEWLWRACRMW